MKTYDQLRSRLTHKQVHVLEKIVLGPGEGQLIDLDQLLASINYETTKGSMHFTLRGLLRRGMIVKAEPEIRRGRRRVVFAPTMRGVNRIRDDSSGGAVIMDGFGEETVSRED